MEVALDPNSTKTVVTFEMLTTPNQAKSRAAGRLIVDEQEACRIRFPGNKQTVGVYPAHEVFRQGVDEYGIVGDITYAMEFNEQYRRFKQGVEQTVAGTPLEELPFLTKGRRMELKAQNVHTVETLAGLDGQPLKTLGPSGRDWKNQAIEWLQGRASTSINAHTQAQLEQQNAVIAALMAKVDMLEGRAASDHEDAPADAPPEAESAGEEVVAGKYEDYSAADLRHMLQDAEPSLAIAASWSKAKLIENLERLRLEKLAKN